MVVAICASLAWVSWKSARTWLNILRVLARCSASSSARRAKPSAAAATEVRNTSSVRIATLKPSPAAPMRWRQRHPAIGETQPRQRVRRDHFDARGDLETGRAGVDDEGRDAARAGRLAGAGEHHVEVGDAAVGNPGLLAIDHRVVALDMRAALHRGDVGAGLRLRERERRDRFAAAPPVTGSAPSARACLAG